MPQTDEFGRHEVLHTAQLYEGHWYTDICDHVVVKMDPDLAAKADAIASLMAEFYQACGAKFL